VPRPNAVLSMAVRLDPPLDRPAAEALRAEGGLAVGLDGGRRLRLDPRDPRSAGFAQVLDGLQRQDLPGYLEFDPGTSAVTHVRTPHVSEVLAVQPVAAGVLEVMLADSRHVLREGSDDFAELRGRLEHAVRTRAPVILVEDDDHQVIAVSVPPPGAKGPRPPAEAARESPRSRIRAVASRLRPRWLRSSCAPAHPASSASFGGVGAAPSVAGPAVLARSNAWRARSIASARLAGVSGIATPYGAVG
jgi:hypothetical protein